MNYNYTNVKVRIIDIDAYANDNQHEAQINLALGFIQDKCGIIENIESFPVERKGTIRTIITYREIKEKEEQK
jgi:hypothetical protein